MKQEQSSQERFTALRAALARLAEQTPGLRTDGPGNSAELILQEHDEGPMVTLQVGEHTATVRAYSGSDPAGTSELEDHLSVDLTRAYRWDAVVFEGADSLAYHLYKHMLRRRKAVSTLEPDAD